MTPARVQKSATPRLFVPYIPLTPPTPLPPTSSCILVFCLFSFPPILHSQLNLSTRIHDLRWSSEGRGVKPLKVRPDSVNYPSVVPLSRSRCRNGEGSVDLCASASSGLFPFPQLATRLESQFHVWLTRFCPSHSVEETSARYRWSIRVSSAPSGFLIRLFDFNFPL